MSNPERPPPDDAPRRNGWSSRTTEIEGPGPASSGPRAVVEPAPVAQSTLLAPGAIVGDKYLIDGILGEGGLGVVVSATHLHLDQKVAIKYLRGIAPRDRGVTDRFLREARLAAQIQSEHVVRVFDVATLTDGTPYMVMEHLEGADLRTVLADQGAMLLSTAVDYVLQACEALAEAHGQGIVHRDLKPDNLFLAKRAGGKDTLKILDFGISKLSDRYTSSSRVNVVTQAGDRLGTPLYMSPEQLEGVPDVDARTDVWAVGVVLYELCTGAMPFTGESLPALCTAVLTKTPIPATGLRPGLPPELDLIISRCLEKSRDDRYQNVAELAEELRPFASSAAQGHVRHIVQLTIDAGESVRPPRWEGSHPTSTGFAPVSIAPPRPEESSLRARAAFALGLAAAAIVIAVVAFALGRGPSSTPPPSAATVPPAPREILTVVDRARVTRPPASPAPALSSEEGATQTDGAAPAASNLPASKAAPPPPVRPRPAARAAVAAPASSDTSGVIDPFQ